MNKSSDITITSNSVKCTIDMDRKYNNDEEMLNAINDIKALIDMLPKDEDPNELEAVA